MKRLFLGGEIMTKTKSRMKQYFLILLSILTIFSNTAICYAEVNYDNEICPCYVNIDRAFANLDISGIKANCSATISANNSMNLKIVMELQKSKSSGYETVETWTSSKTGTYLAMTESRLINVLSDYRLKITFTAGNETEVVYKY